MFLSYCTLADVQKIERSLSLQFGKFLQHLIHASCGSRFADSARYTARTQASYEGQRYPVLVLDDEF